MKKVFVYCILLLIGVNITNSGGWRSSSTSKIDQDMPQTKPPFYVIENSNPLKFDENEQKKDKSYIVIPDTLNIELNKNVDSVMKVFRLKYDTTYILQCISEIEYRKHDLKYRSDVFAWQFYTSKLIFFFVMMIVFTGLVFSAWHFVRTLKGSLGTGIADTTITDTTGTGAASTHSTNTRMNSTGAGINDIELSASMTELKIKTSLIGLVILIVSIVFFFLYIKFVYPISVVSEDTKDKAEQTQ